MLCEEASVGLVSPGVITHGVTPSHYSDNIIHNDVRRRDVHRGREPAASLTDPAAECAFTASSSSGSTGVCETSALAVSWDVGI